jgi:hypothetical protein
MDRLMGSGGNRIFDTPFWLFPRWRDEWMYDEASVFPFLYQVPSDLVS